MSFGRLEKPISAHRPMAEINVTPLVDVMLVLLVIFMIAAPLMADRLALDLPPLSPPTEVSADEAEALNVAITPEGQPHWDGQAVTWTELEARLGRAAAANATQEVRLRADKRVAYEHIARMVAAVQKAGLRRIGFMTDSASAEAMGLPSPDTP
ncbi:biopolymer transporter ExbD [Hydrogenophaga sp. 5NK40-0174]|uniref:ExbD/TolR family protein n=1 Tax=Hydrogenophaga sp. 5NK40-0174 TaxID=3127649 RepID=UPI00310B0EDB